MIAARKASKRSRRQEEKRPAAQAGSGQRRYGYDAVQRSSKRKSRSTVLVAEDQHLQAKDRRKLLATTREACRNFAVASWALRKHLDFVSRFSFQCQNKNPEFKRAVEATIERRSARQVLDVAGRHPLRRFIRLFEAMRTMDGDVFALKLMEGSLQAIEGDRVRDPDDAKLPGKSDQKLWQHGIRTDLAGRSLEMAIHRRDGKRYELERVVAAEKVIHHAHYTRFDMVRGISPFAQGLNELLDAYESIDYAKARLKVAQLFGLVLTRNAEEAPATITQLGSAAAVDAEEEEEAAGDRTQYEVNFGGGPVLLDLDPGDDAKFLDNKTPATEAVNFINDLIALALKSVDIPFSFWREDFTNFFGSRAALTLYLMSCAEKRADVKDVLNHWTDWQLERAQASGELVLPAGEPVIFYDWQAAGFPWWNPMQEVTANERAVANCFTSRRRIVAETMGCDFFDLLDEIEEENKAMEAHGITNPVQAKKQAIVAP